MLLLLLLLLLPRMLVLLPLLLLLLLLQPLLLLLRRMLAPSSCTRTGSTNEYDSESFPRPQRARDVCRPHLTRIRLTEGFHCHDEADCQPTDTRDTMLYMARQHQQTAPPALESDEVGTRDGAAERARITRHAPTEEQRGEDKRSIFPGIEADLERCDSRSIGGNQLFSLSASRAVLWGPLESWTPPRSMERSGHYNLKIRRVRGGRPQHLPDSAPLSCNVNALKGGGAGLQLPAPRQRVKKMTLNLFQLEESS